MLPTRTETIRTHRAAGGGIAAVYPIHYPRALLRAFGLLPVEVWGPPGVDTGRGDAMLQPYTCGIVRCGLSFLLDGGLGGVDESQPAAPGVDVVLVPHACDSLQGLGSVLLDFVQPRRFDRPVLTLYLPRGAEDEAFNVEFLASEIRALHDRLVEITGARPDEETLHQCIDREQRADGLMGALLRQRRALPLTNRALYAHLRAREFLPAEAFIDHASAALSSAGAETGSGRVPVLLSGIVPDPREMLDALDDASGWVVADDMACVSRRIYPDRSHRDPFMRMAGRLLAGPPDPTRGCEIGARIDHLTQRARESGAQGVIFYVVKFCEPELFQLPRVCRGLEQAGLSTLRLEIDVAEPLPDQIVTRLEAFMEMLAGVGR